MSKKSFAIFSIFTALICGTFFYPQAPRRITPIAASTSSGAPRIVSCHEVPNTSLQQSTSRIDTKGVRVVGCDVAALNTKSTPTSYVAYGMVK
jgi:hypothetical protein